jgi:hypothetical protein
MGTIAAVIAQEAWSNGGMFLTGQASYSEKKLPH